VHTARLSRGIAAAALLAATSIHSAGATAGDMSLTIANFAAPIEILSFSTGASQTSGATGGGAGRPSFDGMNFVAPESTVSPTEWLKLASGEQISSAVLQVLSPVSGKLVSDWTFTNALLTSTEIGQASGGVATVQFSLSFGAIAYRVYAADGSIAQKMCWNVATNLSCL
jgi:type VI protein secretion system component Hcp